MKGGRIWEVARDGSSREVRLVRGFREDVSAWGWRTAVYNAWWVVRVRLGIEPPPARTREEALAALQADDESCGTVYVR